MYKYTVIYYASQSGESPVKKFINSLPKSAKAKTFRIFQNIETYGLLSILPHVKKLTGTTLWEIRLLGKNNIRIIYATITKDQVLILHGFYKKTQKTPLSEIRTALNRLRDY